MTDDKGNNGINREKSSLSWSGKHHFITTLPSFRNRPTSNPMPSYEQIAI